EASSDPESPGVQLEGAVAIPPEETLDAEALSETAATGGLIEAVAPEEALDAPDPSVLRGQMDRRAQQALLENDEFGWPGGGETWSQSGIHMRDGSPAYPVGDEDEVELTLSAEEIIPDSEAPPPWSVLAELPPTDPQALSAARKIAQEELVREMQEALRRAGSTDDDGWLSTAPGTAEVPEPPAEVVAPLAPLQLGPNGDDSEPAQDLWRIVSFDTARAESSGTSALEDAVRRVDASLLAMVEEADAVEQPTSEAAHPTAFETSPEVEVRSEPVAGATNHDAFEEAQSAEPVATWDAPASDEDEAEVVIVEEELPAP